MNTDKFSKNAWKAQLDAIFKLAGIQGDFNTEKSAFLAASMNTAFFTGQIIPEGTDPATLPDASSTTVKNSIDSHFNESLYNIADVLPASNTPYFTPSGNKRLAGYRGYLNWVDSGAPRDQAAYRVWQTDKTKADGLQTKLDNLLTEAQKEYNAIAKPTTDFDGWVSTSYPGRFQVQTAQKDLDLVNATLLNEESRALGPMGLQLVSAIDDANKGNTHHSHSDGQYTMLCNESYEPFYTMNSPLFNQQYDSWTRMVTSWNDTPAVTQVIEVEHADSFNYSTYGLDESKVEAGLSIADPFFFFGEGSYSTREEKQQMFQSNNIGSIKISITAMGQPKAFTISPGDWYASDPKTAFHNRLKAGAPNDLSDSLYPFVTQVIVGYGLAYKVELDQKTYNELKEFHSKDTKSQVISVFDLFFEGGRSSSSSSTNGFDHIEFDENSSTITVKVDTSMVPALIGVVVYKDGGSEARDDSGDFPLVPLPSPADLLTGDLSKFKPLNINIDKTAIGRMLTEYDQNLNEKQQEVFRGLLRRLLQPCSKMDDKTAVSLPSRFKEVIEKISLGHDFRNDDSFTGLDGKDILESVTFRQKCGRSEVSIVVESKVKDLVYTSDEHSDHTSTTVELSSDAATTAALSELSALLDEVKQSLKIQHISLYLNAARQLDELVRPIITTLASLAGVHVKGANYSQLVRPVAEMLSLVNKTCYSPISTIAPQPLGTIQFSGTMLLYSWGALGKRNKWAARTPLIPHLTGSCGYAINFLGKDGAFLDFTMTGMNVRVRFGDGRWMPLQPTGGNNAYFWFNGASLDNATIEMDVSGRPKREEDRSVTYSFIQV